MVSSIASRPLLCLHHHCHHYHTIPLFSLLSKLCPRFNNKSRSWIHWMPNVIVNVTTLFASANWKTPKRWTELSYRTRQTSRYSYLSASICIASKSCSNRTPTTASWVYIMHFYATCWPFIPLTRSQCNIWHPSVHSCTDRWSRHLTDRRDIILVRTGTAHFPIRRNQSGTVLQRW